MISKKDKIEQFKRDLRSLKYYECKVNEISDELLKLSRIMHEPKSIKYGERLGSSALNYLECMEREEVLKNELKLHIFMIEKIKSKLDLLSDYDRILLDQLYVRRKGFTYVAQKMGVSERKLKYDVDEIIRKIV